MTKIKNNIVALVAVVIAIIALLIGHAGVKTRAVSVTTNLPSLGVNSLTLGSGCDQSYTSCTVGTVIDSSGNTNTGLTINGEGISVVRKTVALSATTASTTPCALLSPAATSTILRASIYSTVGSTTATVTIATSSTAYATTSTSLTATLTGLAPVVYVPVNNAVLAPSSYVVFGFSNYALPSNGYQFTGVCTATFQQL